MVNRFERYGCVDMVVNGLQSALDTLEEKLGIPPNIPVHDMMFGAGVDTAYFFLNEDLNLTASAIQMIGLRAFKKGEPHNEIGRRISDILQAYITSQPMYRPVITHATSLGTPSQQDLNEIVELLSSRGVPHIHIPEIDCLYVGLVEDNDRVYYDPAVDCGTRLEFAVANIEYPGLMRPPTMPATPEVATLPAGTIVRPVARVHLADSAEAVIDRLRAIMDWPEEGDLGFIEGDDYRSIVVKPNHPLSAVWEIVEPTKPGGRAAAALARYGSGVWSTRLGVYGLDAKLDDLDKRHTGWERIEDGPEGARVEINRWDLRGPGVELQDLPVVLRGTGAGPI